MPLLLDWETRAASARIAEAAFASLWFWVCDLYVSSKRGCEREMIYERYPKSLFPVGFSYSNRDGQGLASVLPHPNSGSNMRMKVRMLSVPQSSGSNHREARHSDPTDPSSHSVSI